MSKEIDIVGKRYGNLTVLKFHHSVNYKSGNVGNYYLCKCDCGKDITVLKSNLLNGHTRSCGCLKNRPAANRAPSDDVRCLCRILSYMKQRCSNPNTNRYHRYGGRGIKICDEWMEDKEAFCKWALEHGYKPGLTIERIDNDKGYCPENCRWIPRAEQTLNYSKNRILEHNGERKPLSQWARELGMNPHTLQSRLNWCGWSVEKALTTPVRRY